MLRSASLALAASLLVLSGCSQLSLFQKPATELPAAWKDVPATGQAAAGDRWFTIYGDAILERLVDEGLANNRDLAIAAARIEEAQALLRITDADRSPAVGANAQRDRTRSSGRSSMPLPPGVPLERNTNRATVDVSYELDPWGRLRGASNASRADLLATEAARETVRIALVNQIVQSYYNLLALDMQVTVTQRTLELRARDLKLQGIRYNAGLIADFNLRQLEAEVAAARAQLPVLQQRRTAEEVALVTLLGRTPRAFVEQPIAIATDIALR